MCNEKEEGSSSLVQNSTVDVGMKPVVLCTYIPSMYKEKWMNNEYDLHTVFPHTVSSLE